MKKFAVIAAAITMLAALAALLTVERPSNEPRLVLLLAVDQLRADYLTRFDGVYEGGFAKLTTEGAVFTNSYYRHGWTVTAAGHAVLSTGMHPSHSGMVGNEWYDSIQKKGVNCVADEAAKPIGGAGVKASPRSLLADTIGDRLKQKHGGSKVVSFSFKDRAAVLLAGRQGDAAYWFSDDCGCLITSDHYMSSLPGWLTAFNEKRVPDSFQGRPWERMLPDAAIYERLARQDEMKGEGDESGSTFPHGIEAAPPSKNYYARLRDTPYADEVLLEAALAALDGESLGADDEPDILAIGFSATDLIGHKFGPRSQEAMDQVLRLDRMLARLFAAVDEKVGLENTLIALSADHGVLDLVEQLQADGETARRVPAKEFVNLVNQAVAKQFPELPEVVVYQAKPHLYLNLPLIEEKGLTRDEVEKVAKEALLEHPVVVNVYTHSDLAGDPDPDDLTQRLYRNSFFERRSPHLTLHLIPNTDPYGPDGTGHGSAYATDRNVPILLWGRWIRPGKYEQESGPEDLAPTLGKIMGVEMLKEPDARILMEALR